MSLLDEIKDEQASSRKGPSCGVCTLLVEMDKSDSADLKAALADTTVYATVIAKALSRRDIRVNASTISRHRKGECMGG